MIEFFVAVKLELARMQNIPSMAVYAQAWASLAAAFESLGMLSNAADCRTRAVHYACLDGGEYVRLIESSLAELIFVEAA